MADVVLAEPTVDRFDHDDDYKKHARYSGEMHKNFIVLNGGILVFLQMKYESTKTSPFQTYHPTILSFLVFFLVCVILRMSEIKLRDPKLSKFVGNVSHFFGALATLLLLSVIDLVFTLFLLPLTLVWFSQVAYISFKELNLSPGNTANADPPNRPPI